MTHDTNNNDFWADADVISVYTRADAIADGTLIDVTSTAREAGFRWPVAVTATVWAECVEWSPQDTERQTPQDMNGRLWDVVWMARAAIGASRSNGDNELLYQLYCVPRDGHADAAELVTLKLHCGPGDDAAPVITIMQPHED